MAAPESLPARVQRSIDELEALAKDQREWLRGLDADLARSRTRLEALGGVNDQRGVREREKLKAWCKEADGQRDEALAALATLSMVVETLRAVQGGVEAPQAHEVSQPKERRKRPPGAPGHRRRYAAYLIPMPLLLLTLYLVGFAVSGAWPPTYLLAGSGSMQHGGASALGPIDTGDAVVVAPTDHVVTYLEGRRTGHSTYGDYGDVLVFEDPLNDTGIPFLHRAVAYVRWNATAGGFDVPELQGLDPGMWQGVDVDGNATDRPWGLHAFSLQGVGWRGDWTVTYNFRWLVSVWGNLGTYPGPYQIDGYITWGDNNVYTLPTQVDPWIIAPSKVVGVAQGELPLFGLLRLSLEPSTEGCCDRPGSTDTYTGAPANSWWALVAMVTLPVAAVLAVQRVMRLTGGRPLKAIRGWLSHRRSGR